DSTGDGVADIAALDLDDDGLPDHFYTDPTGQGTWDHQVSGAPADSVNEPLEWIVRTGPAPGAEVPPDPGSFSDSTVVCDIAFGTSGYALPPETGEYSGRPGDQRIERPAAGTATEPPVTEAPE